ncbi:MAG: S-layer homology domain-containing protein [Veillonella sp.]|nr:S-layer homology domain-containing protein [Veillonella sp.]
MNKRKRLLTLLINGVLLSSLCMVANAADNVAGAGSGVAIGTGSNAQRDGVVAIGRGAHTNYAGGSGYANVNGDVAIGENATTHSYYDQSGSVAVGKNAYVENTIGRQEKLFAFNQTTFNTFGMGSLPQQPDKVVTGVAVGDNTYVRTGGVMVGSHNYRGKIGDITVNTDTYTDKRKAGLGLYSTTLGSNSFTNGTVATTTGALNVISSNYDGNNIANATRNFSSVTDLAKDMRKLVKDNKSGGSTLAIGGGNKADYTQLTAMTGVNNTVTGTATDVAKLNQVSGFNNTITNASNNIVMGNDHVITADNTIAIGGLSSSETRSVANTTTIGYDARASVEGGVALGSNSNATVDKGAAGYDILTNAPSTDTSSTWKSTASAVSVGDVTNGVTRQITSVAAGTNDTDAVNVAQLKLLRNNVGGDITNIQNNISRLDKRVNRGVAGAAALAALHPLDFDPDAKWDFAAGYGHYHSGNAAALGAFYRPNEDVQLSVGSTVGNGETVVNAGLSVKVGAHSNVSRSRVAIGKEVLELKKTVALQNAQIQKLTTLLNGVAGTNMKADRTTLFPDVPSNHWAYEAVSDLSRRGLVEGYPDGTFGGDRMMTRYEFAQIVYRVIQNGVQVNEQLVTEFSPEMALFRVDTVAKNHQGQPIIERVRVNKNNI